MKRKNYKKYGIIIGILAIVTTLFLPNVWATPTTITISPNDIGQDKTYKTFQDVINSVDEGSTINLEDGEYGESSEVITIEKGITINGKGLGTTIKPQIKIDETTNANKVVLENFKSPIYEPASGNVFVQVNSPVNLEITNLTIRYIARDLEKEVKTLQLTSTSSNSTINIKNSSLDANFDGILIESSHNMINIDNSKIGGQVALSLQNGDSNTMNLTNNTELVGRSYSGTKYSTEAIQIINQQSLNFNIENSTLKGVNSYGTTKTYTISFDGVSSSQESKSKNTTITIKGNSHVIEEDTEGKIINFGKESNASELNNVIIVEPTVEFTKEVDKKYESSPEGNYEIVGIFDKNGKLKIKAYTRGTTIPAEDLPGEIDGYRLDGLFNKYTEETGYTEEFQKETAVSKNMDIYPKYVKLLKITIGENPAYTVDEKTKLSETKEHDEIKAKLQALKDAGSGKTFMGFSNGKEIIAQTVEELMEQSFTEDTTITASFKISVTLKYNGKSHTEYYEDNITLGTEEYNKLVNKAKENLEGKSFNRIYDESDEQKKAINEKTVFTKDVTLIAVYDFKVQLGKSGSSILVEENTSIGSEKYQQFENEAAVDGKTVIRFEDQDGKTIKNDTAIEKETILTPIYKWTVTFDDDKIEFTTKSDNKTIKSKYDDWKTKAAKSTKDFDHFENEENQTITEDTKIDKDMTLTAKYTVNVSVNGEVKYTLNEGEALGETRYNEQVEKFNKTTDKIFKGFFAEERKIEKDTSITQHINLVPKYSVTVKYNEETITIDENSTIPEEKFTEWENKANEPKDKHFVKFTDDKEGEQITNKTPITKITVLKAEYEVYVTPENFTAEKLTLPENGKITAEQYETLVKAAEKANKHFDHFENQDGQIIEANKTKINKDMSLTAKYNVKVSVNGEEKYTINEGDKLGETKYEALKKEVSKKDKQFKQFISDDTVIDKDTKIDEDIDLTPQYSVDITFGTKKETINEGEKLTKEQLDSFEEEAKKDIDYKQFKNFVVGDEVVTTDMEFNKNTTLEAKYEVTVTYNGNEETLIEGESIGETKYNELLKKAEAVDKKVHSFKDQDGNPIGPSTPIHKNTVLEPSYKIDITYGEVTIPIDDGTSLGAENYKKLEDEAKKGIEGIKNYKYLEDENGNKIDKDTTFNKNTTLKAIYTIDLKFKNQNTDIQLKEGEKLGKSNYDKLVEKANEGISNKTLKKLVDSEGNTITENSTFSKHTNIIPIYTIKVTFNNEDLNIQLDEGEKLGKSNYDKLVEKANEGISGKRLKELVDSKGNKITEDSKFNQNTNIKAVYSVNITYKNNVVLTLDEGTELSEKDYNKLKEAAKVEGKNVAGFKSGDKSIKVGTKITTDTEVTAFYNVTVKFNDVVITLDENTKLSEEQKEKLQKAAKVNNKEFVNFLKDGEDFDLDSIISENTIITAKYNVQVKIGDETYILSENQSLNESSDIELIKEALNKLKLSKDKEFSRFVDEKGNTIDLDTAIKNNITITAKFKIVITIEDEEFILEEGQSLNNLSKQDKARLKKLTEKEGYNFTGFKDSDGNIIEENQKLNDDMTLEPTFQKEFIIINPNTIDNIKKYIWLEIIGLLSTISGIIIFKKRNKKHA